MTRVPAVFLDRDGTIVDDPGFLKDPKQVRLLDGAAHAISRLNKAKIPVIVVTNQSGIGRGLISWDAYKGVSGRVEELLAAESAVLTATFVCPHHPELTGPCLCRKPGVKLYREAAVQYDVDLARSWWIGDRLSDVMPAQIFAGTALLVETGTGATYAGTARALGFAVVKDLAAAVEVVLSARAAAETTDRAS
jgi:D-glycero-D-manno-heptose 1,7-bisphosphate phosphatase